MPYQVKLTNSVNEFGKRLSPKIRQAAKRALKELAENPYRGKELQAALCSFRSHRFMRYRIIYKIDPSQKQVVVWAIGHRRDIYENLGEHLLNMSPEK